MSIYIENPKKSNPKLIELLLSECRRVINTTLTLKNQYLYSTSEHVETEIKNTLPFRITAKKIKYLGINLMKYLQDDKQ